MADEHGLDPAYVEAIKQFEGYAPKAEWDYKQHSVGYGSKATYPGEQLSREEASARLDQDLTQAAGYVDRAFPQLPEGARAALIDLTHNAGPGWINGGLGKAVGAGDWGTARDIFVQYNRAGGQVLPGLVNRRNQTAAWLTGSQQPQTVDTVGGEAAPFGGAYPGTTAPQYAPQPQGSPLNAQSLAARTTPAGAPLTNPYAAAYANLQQQVADQHDEEAMQALMKQNPMQQVQFGQLQRPAIQQVRQFNPMGQFFRRT